MIELKQVTKTYGQSTRAVDGLDLTINDGEIVVLIGESGSGKTTTLQMINRIEEATSGSILINGVDVRTIRKSDLRRSIGYVIQDIGLFLHKTVAENIATVPLLVKREKSEIEGLVKEMMGLIGLDYEEFGHRYPMELSGGQQQRVGVARALANKPDVILMDEPFSALDPITREQLQDELLRLHDELQKTIVFVTHDMDEAVKIADKIAIMQDGRIAQFDTPEEILKNPANDFVAQFIGQSRIWNTPDILKAVDVMAKHPAVIEPNRTVIQAITLAQKHNVPVIAVAEKSRNGKRKFLGFAGLNRLLGAVDNSIKVQDIMKTGVIEIPHDTPLPEVLSLREEHGLYFSPVIDEEGFLAGIISNTSIINVLSQVIPGKEEY